MKPLLCTAFVVIAAAGAACTPTEGEEGGPCFPNDTCSAGLNCVSALCVEADSGETEGEGEGEGEGEADCETRAADVRVTSAADVESLRNVCTVGGTLFVQGTDLVAFSLPRLVTADGIDIFENPALTTLSFPALEHVGTDFSVLDNAALVSLSAPLLESVADGGRSQGIFLVGRNRQMTSLTLPRLTTVGANLGGAEFGYLEVFNTAITSMQLPQLDTVFEDLSFHDNPNLTVLEVPALVRVRESFKFVRCDALQTVSAPQLVSAGEVNIRENATLATLSLPALTSLESGAIIVDNPSLSTCVGVLVADVGDCVQ